MERLRFFDLSFCENEVSDLNQVQRGQLGTGLAVSFNTANRSNFDSNFSIQRIGLTSANILASGAAVVSLPLHLQQLPKTCITTF